MAGFHTIIKTDLVQTKSTSATTYNESCLISCMFVVLFGVHANFPRFRRYYFVVEEDNTPLLVTVTPCDAPLEWRLTLQELPEDRSGEGSGIRIKSPNRCCNSAVI